MGISGSDFKEEVAEPNHGKCLSLDLLSSCGEENGLKHLVSGRDLSLG